MTAPHYATYDTDFKTGFDFSAITSRDPISTGSSNATVDYVTTPNHDAYLIGLENETGKHTPNRPENIISACKIAELLGANIPTIAYNEANQEFALKPFQGEQLLSASRDACQAARKETFQWDCAKMLVLGHWDFAGQNVLINENGEYRIIDLQALNKSLIPNIQVFISKFTDTFNYIDHRSRKYRCIETKAIALSEYFAENPLIEQHETDVIRRNRDVIREAFPIGEILHDMDYTIPDIDDTVIPPQHHLQ